MPKQSPQIGVPTVSLGQPDFTGSALPFFTSLTPVACAVTPLSGLNNEIRNDLDTTATYQFLVAPWGYDKINGGWTIGKASQPSASVTVTASQYIRLSVLNASWPSGFLGTKFVAIFMKKNSGNYQLCQLAYLDPSNDFDTAISAEPLAVLPSRSLAFLQNASGDTTFGSMNPYPMTEEAVGETTGGVNYDRSASTVSVSPDSTPDYQVVTARGCNVTFSLLASDLKDVVKATAGLYTKITGLNGTSTVEETQQTILTAAAVLKGNRHIIINETSSAGKAVKRLFVGNLTTSQTAVTISRTKTAVASLQFNLQTAATDSLLSGLNSEIAVSRY